MHAPRHPLPVLLWHGRRPWTRGLLGDDARRAGQGGSCGSCSTDFDVLASDAVERAARAGATLARDLCRRNRSSALKNEAWETFRIGP